MSPLTHTEEYTLLYMQGSMAQQSRPIRRAHRQAPRPTFPSDSHPAFPGLPQLATTFASESDSEGDWWYNDDGCSADPEVR
ncbi:hypothetical protein EV182_002503 [Spiromyces aspiralis]|uniref:Uncharacterized protein n=1 Tax=Spiromyces aspiralis TaxID=68401 RepID=A0ACC1HT51_9FUNG|nr:hypothetical protein EV182_002503 [Spiromyces aspiralis]